MGAGINWGRGRMHPYESLASFAAKFRALNTVSVSTFKAFLASHIGRPFAPDLPRDETEVKCLAGLLDEPFDVVRTLNIRPLNNDEAKMFPKQSKHTQPMSHIRVCDSCLSCGIHLVFTEIPWVQLCPLHQLRYRSLAMPWVPSHARFGKYIQTLEKCLKNANQHWPSLQNVGVESNYSQECLKNLNVFTGWLSSLDFSVQRIEKQALWASQSCVCHANGKPISFEKLLHLCPPPKSVSNVIKGESENFVFHSTWYDRPVSDEIAILAKRIGLGNAIYIIKRSAQLYEANLSFKNLLNGSVASIRREHPLCQCEWGWSNYLGWQQVDPNRWPHWGYVCPVVFAANELISEWGDFTSVLSRHETKLELLRINETLQNYHRLCSGPIANSMSTHISQSSTHGNRGELAISPNLESVLNDLISLDMQIHTEELQNWLLELTRGADPRDRTRSGAELMLLSRGGKVQLLTWRRQHYE
jgi:hypothetical protein